MLFLSFGDDDDDDDDVDDDVDEKEYDSLLISLFRRIFFLIH